MDTAVSLGLLLNEILNNAVSYGCEMERVCRIYFYLNDEGNQNFNLKIGDNGSGIDNIILSGGEKFLGLNLIDVLVEQLKGKYKRKSNKNGTHYEIHFKEINL
jgi:two-component sensor histidine kinase